MRKNRIFKNRSLGFGTTNLVEKGFMNFLQILLVVIFGEYIGK